MRENYAHNEQEWEPSELFIGQGGSVSVTDWPDVFSKLQAAVAPLPWGQYVAWVLFDTGGQQITAGVDSRDSFVARYSDNPKRLEVLHAF